MKAHLFTYKELIVLSIGIKQLCVSEFMSGFYWCLLKYVDQILRDTNDDL